MALHSDARTAEAVYNRIVRARSLLNVAAELTYDPTHARELRATLRKLDSLRDRAKALWDHKHAQEEPQRDLLAEGSA